MVATLPAVPTLNAAGDWRTAPKKVDWRTGTEQADWRTPTQIQQPKTGGYTSQLPAELQTKPAFKADTFWGQFLGAEDVNQVLGTFGGQGVGKVYSGSGFGQFNAKQDQEIQAAAEKYGIPANFLKSIIAAESSGKLSDANWISNNRPQSGGLLPYIGVYKNAADSRGMGHLWGQAVGNSAVQAEILAGVLRSQYDQLRKQNPNWGWTNVASYHYSGQPVPNGWRDEFQNMSNNDYTAKVTNWWKSLDQKAGNTWNNYTSPSSQPSTGSSIGNIGSIFGGTAPRISQEMGLTDFAVNGKGKDWYGYAGAYGAQGHAGIDYSMNPGGKLYAPVSGTVVRAGGSGYYTDERYGNAAGTGELRLKLDNGDEIILGHMGSIVPKVGQRINAGDYVGLSGTFNGGHVHVEYRKYDPSAGTSSGYKALDPRVALQGAGQSTFKTAAIKAQEQQKQLAYIHGAGIQAARAAAGAASTSDFAKLVYDQVFLKSKLASAA